MKFNYIPPIKKSEIHDCINPFNRDAVVYCAKCTKRGSWKEIVKMSYFLKDKVPTYEFFCHGASTIVDAYEFMDKNRINGKSHKSYLAFGEKDGL